MRSWIGRTGGTLLAGMGVMVMMVGGCASTGGARAGASAGEGGGSVIFLHPDGSGANMWGATRMLYAGPDGDLEWDKLPEIGLYRGHLRDALAASSNAGGTIHAYGVKVGSESFGNDNGEPLVGVTSVAREALARGKAVGIVSTAAVVDAGTGTFLASTSSRRNSTEIAEQMLAARPQVMLGGGERFFLPKGVRGTHGEGVREDGRNLLEEARSAGYVVITTREELLALRGDEQRVLGLFASNDTFQDDTEENQREKGLTDLVAGAPTYAEMVDAALTLLSKRESGFLLVAEEEGTDNFAGDNNARGTLAACKRADDGIGVARRFIAGRSDVLLLVAADSDCGGMQVVSEPELTAETALPKRDEDNGSALDGRDGTGTLPFVAAPDRAGRRIPFAIAWASSGDVAGAVLVRGEGARAAELITPSMDNTRIPVVIRAGLFGGDGSVQSPAGR